MEKSTLKKAEKIAQTFFTKMNFSVEIKVTAKEENILSLNIKTDEPQILIGEHGRTLGEIQKILNKILYRTITAGIYFDVDVNNYKANKARYLDELAQNVADEVSLGKIARELAPMSAIERRIIHLELAKRSDVKTESIGEDPDRRVVVKPA